MQLDEDLELIKRSTAGCSLVAFGDLRTRLVLCSVSDQHLAQERLNHFCKQASSAFSAADAVAKAQESGRVVADHAVLFAPNGVHLFVRSLQNNSDVLCCVSTNYSGVEDLLISARAFFGQLARVA